MADPHARTQPGAGSRRLALYLPSFAPGGAERVMLHLADALGRMPGLEIDLVVTHNRGPLAGHVPAHVQLHVLGAPRTVLAVPHLVRYLRARRPQALLATMLGPIGTSVVASRLARTGTRVVARQPNLFGPEFLGEAHAGNAVARLGDRFLPRLLAAADAVIAVSADVRSQVVSRGVPAERVHAIANPLALAAVRLEAAAPVDHPWLQERRDVPVIVTAGRLVRQKGYVDLLHAVASLNNRRPVRCLILGEGVLRPELMRLADELGIADCLDMPGVVAHPCAYFARADVFASSSLWEGMPNVILEALGCGTPVVATDCPGGTREILAALDCGMLVEPGQPEALAAAIERTLAGSAPATPAPADIERHFGIDAVARRYLQVLTGE